MENNNIKSDEKRVFSKNSHQEGWTCTIRPAGGWGTVNFLELWQYRDLVMMFVRRDFATVYKQTILGPLWYLLQPIMTTLVMTIIFSGVAGLPTEGLPPVLFYLSGVVVWRYFADCLQKTSNTFVGNVHIFGKIYFPRLTVPLSVVLSNLISLGIQLGLLAGIGFYFQTKGVKVQVHPTLFFLPLLIIQMAALGLGCGLIVSSLTTKYRDLAQLVGFGVQLWMYITPIVYPMSMIPEHWRWAMMLNPMAPVVEGFRKMVFGVGSISVSGAFSSVMVTLLILSFGMVLFSRIEKNFMDTV